MDIDQFDFDLPDELVAQEPPAARGDSRLLVLHRRSGAVEHVHFEAIARYLTPGDLLVLNNTKVFPARLLGTRVPSGGAVECLLMRQLPPQLPTPQLPAPNATWEGGQSGVGHSVLWDALMHPGQKLHPGARVVFAGEGHPLHGEVIAMHFHGRRTVRLWSEAGEDVAAAVERLGHVPLPPYIKRADTRSDRERYQTVYARERGSIAAPTAGLHFTEEVLAALAAIGVERAEVTLHVGYGTFKPIRVDSVADHAVDPEPFTVTAAAADALTRARRAGRRIVAVGTTTVRALESLVVDEDDRVLPAAGEAQVFIRPGHEFRLVDGLVTNFHLPRSSLLVLVSAFAGRDRILAAYRDAVARRYRFYSYGDAMLIV